MGWPNEVSSTSQTSSYSLANIIDLAGLETVENFYHLVDYGVRELKAC